MPTPAEQPIREAIVELIQSGGNTLATTTTDSNGNYALTAPANTSVFVRVQAQLRKTTTPARSIRVLNNTNGNALYVLDSAVFNSGATNQTKNLLAGSGWGGTSYTGTRSAAPFAILDTLLAAAEFVVANGNAALDLPALDVFWSPQNNRVTSGRRAHGPDRVHALSHRVDGRPAAGIYVLGAENVDTDEYDQHVLAHEFQHFLEDTISRTDSPGGPHSPNDRLDLRVAFSEGFANAFSAMVLNDPLYSDSLGAQQARRFSFNMESNAASPAGWYNEASIQSVTWDLYDAASDGSDTVALGYKPLYEAFTGGLRTGPALTSVYPFVTDLKGQARARQSRPSIRSSARRTFTWWTSGARTRRTTARCRGGAAALRATHAEWRGAARLRHDGGRDVQQDRQPVVPAILAGSARARSRSGRSTRRPGRQPRFPRARSGYRAVRERLPRHRGIHHQRRRDAHAHAASRANT